MAQRARSNGAPLPRSRTFGTAAVGARRQVAWLWSRESLLRLMLSLVLSVALWLFITNQQDPRVAQDYPQPLPVSVSNVPDGTTVGNQDLGVVYVRIRRQDPNTPVTPASFRALVNLIGQKPGLHRVKVQVEADPGIDLVSWSPATVPVLLERLQTKRVPVRCNVIGQPPTGYGMATKIQPSSTTVQGPAQLMSQVSQAACELDLAGVRSNVSGTYRLTPENAQGGIVPGHLTLFPSQAHVTVTIQAFSSYKTLPVLAPLSGQPKAGYGPVSVRVTPAEITATGSPAALSAISAAKTAPVSVAHRGAGTFTIRVRVRLPARVSSSTKWVRVRTTLAPLEASSSVGIAIAPYGVGPGLSVHTEPARVLVTIVGPSTALRSAASHMTAVINLTGYGIGTYTFTPYVTAPPGVHMEGVFPSSVTVTLTPSNGG